MKLFDRKPKDTQPVPGAKEDKTSGRRRLYAGLAASAALLAACAPGGSDAEPNNVTITLRESTPTPVETARETNMDSYEQVDQEEAATVMMNMLSRLRDPVEWQQDEFCQDNASVCLTSTQLLDDRGRAGYSRTSYLRVLQSDGLTTLEFNQSLNNDVTSDTEASVFAALQVQDTSGNTDFPSSFHELQAYLSVLGEAGVPIEVTNLTVSDLKNGVNRLVALERVKQNDDELSRVRLIEGKDSSEGVRESTGEDEFASVVSDAIDSINHNPDVTAA